MGHTVGCPICLVEGHRSHDVGRTDDPCPVALEKHATQHKGRRELEDWITRQERSMRDNRNRRRRRRRLRGDGY